MKNEEAKESVDKLENDLIEKSEQNDSSTKEEKKDPYWKNYQEFLVNLA